MLYTMVNKQCFWMVVAVSSVVGRLLSVVDSTFEVVGLKLVTDQVCDVSLRN